MSNAEPPTIPAPGSIWRSRRFRLLHRVVLSEPGDIVAHNCEHPTACEGKAPMNSWRGTVEQFHTDFEPDPEAKYPATAI